MITLSSIGLLALTMSARASFLRQSAQLISERADPIASPGKVAQHTHFVTGGSNFGVEIPSSDYLRQSECTSTGIQEDKSAYWFPQMYFEHANGSFEFVSGGPVIYYLYPDQAGMTTPFPDDFVMITGNTAVPPPYGSAMQKAVSFLCLNFNGVSVRYDYLPADVQCQDGIRAQINFQSCWNGKDVNSPDHQSHVSYRTGGPDSGDCPPEFPVNIPRIFTEIYYGTNNFDPTLAKNTSQPFVFANGDPTGGMYHGDFYNGWERDTLQTIVDNCHCNPYADATCCFDQGMMTRSKYNCAITSQIDEIVEGVLPTLPGNNPVRRNGELPMADPNPPKLRCDVQVIMTPVTKRDGFEALHRRRIAKRFGGDDF